MIQKEIINIISDFSIINIINILLFKYLKKKL